MIIIIKITSLIHVTLLFDFSRQRLKKIIIQTLFNSTFELMCRCNIQYIRERFGEIAFSIIQIELFDD